MKSASVLAPAYPVPALDKGLDLLEHVSAQSEPRSLAEIARSLGRSPGEIFRMLNCLERRGYLSREAGKYRLTLRLHELAHAHSPADALLRAAEAPMRALVADVAESAHLSVLSQGRLVVLSQVESTHRIRLSVEVGGRFPPLRTASGRVLLAHAGKDVLEADPDWKALRPPARAKLLKGLLEIRRAGCLVVKSDLTEGILDVAALVGSPAAGVTAALCVPSLRRVGSPRPVATLRRAVLRRAAEIGTALGLRGKYSG
jgi:DNA-binding IclR family transcriptional regulator